MNPYYNQNYTRKQIDEILRKIKECVRNNKFTISLNENRQENIDLPTGNRTVVISFHKRNKPINYLFR